MGIKVKFSSNRRAVLARANDAAERIGKRIGAFIMTTARRSIRKPPRSQPHAQPGQPPKSQTGILKRFILFAWDPETRSTVIGPRLLPGRVGKDAPEALEKGGASTALIRQDGIVRRRRIRIKARPFMVPAMEARIGELPKLWKDAIRK